MDWHAVLSIPSDLPNERKVIYEAGPLRGGPKFTVWINLETKLGVSVIDAGGRNIELPPVPVPLDRYMYLECFATPGDAGHIQLGICVDGKELTTITGPAELGPKTRVINSLGTDVMGQHPGAFTVTEIAIFSPRPNPTDLERIQKYLADKYALSA